MEGPPSSAYRPDSWPSMFGLGLACLGLFWFISPLVLAALAAVNSFGTGQDTKGQDMVGRACLMRPSQG